MAEEPCPAPCSIALQHEGKISHAIWAAEISQRWLAAANVARDHVGDELRQLR